MPVKLPAMVAACVAPANSGMANKTAVRRDIVVFMESSPKP